MAMFDFLDFLIEIMTPDTLEMLYKLTRRLSNASPKVAGLIDKVMPAESRQYSITFFKAS